MKIKRKSMVELPNETGKITDTLNVADKSTNAPSINIVQQLVGIPTDGIIKYDGDDIPDGYIEVNNILWTNPDITQEFSQQVIEFENTNNYEWVILKVQVSTTNTAKYYYLLKLGEKAWIQAERPYTPSGKGYVQVIYVIDGVPTTSTSITYNNRYTFYTNDDNTVTETTTILIPEQIIGINL